MLCALLIPLDTAQPAIKAKCISCKTEYKLEGALLLKLSRSRTVVWVLILLQCAASHYRQQSKANKGGQASSFHVLQLILPATIDVEEIFKSDFEEKFTVEQVSKASAADRIEKLGVSRAVGLVLIAAWAIVLVLTIVFRRRTEYAERKELYWWEAFYRTGSIIFGGGQVIHLHIWPSIHPLLKSLAGTLRDPPPEIGPRSIISGGG